MASALKADSLLRADKQTTVVGFETKAVRPLERLKKIAWGCFHSQAVLTFLILSYLALVFVPSGTVAVLLLLGGIHSWAIPPVCLLAALAATWWTFLRPLGRSQQIFTLSIFLLSSISAGLFAASLYDSTWDGITYHTEAILSLLHGANPVYHLLDGRYGIWTNYYPKVIWYFGAAAAGGFHSFELGKAYNFFLIFACLCYAWRCFRSMGLSVRVAASLALLTAANPVALSQMSSFYVDGALASLLILIILSGISLLARPALLDRIVFVVCASLSIAIKFTGLVYFGLILCLLLGAMLILRSRGSWKLRFRTATLLLRDATIVAVLGVLILGFNPYMTNVLRGHHPMYPLAGAGKVDIMTPNSPPLFVEAGRSRIRNFAVSFFGQSSDIFGTGLPRTKIPFTVRRAEVRSFSNPDDRIAGWGVFFSGVVLVSLALYLYVRGWRTFPTLGFAMLLILATTFANPYAWWARYVPQLALLPIVLLIAPLAIGSRKIKLAAAVLCLLLLCDSLICAAGSTYSALAYTKDVKGQFGQMAQECGPGVYWMYGQPTAHLDQLPAYRGVVIRSNPQIPEETPSLRSFTLGRAYYVVVHKDACSVPQHS